MIIVGIDGGGTKTHGLALDDQGTVIGVATWAGPLFARWVIDASGGGHWLARLLADPRCGRIGHVLLIQLHYLQRGRCVSDGQRVGLVERHGPGQSHLASQDLE